MCFDSAVWRRVRKRIHILWLAVAVSKRIVTPQKQRGNFAHSTGMSELLEGFSCFTHTLRCPPSILELRCFNIEIMLLHRNPTYLQSMHINICKKKYHRSIVPLRCCVCSYFVSKKITFLLSSPTHRYIQNHKNNRNHKTNMISRMKICIMSQWIIDCQTDGILL